MLSVLLDYGYRLQEDGGEHEQQFSCDLHGDGSDSKPSARLYPDTNHFFCFACGRPRDTIALVQEKEGLEFWPAIKLLEKKFGLPPLPWEPGDDESPPQNELKEDLKAAFEPTETPEQVLERLDRFLMGLCQDRALTPQRCAGFWEAHDRVVAFLADEGDPRQACLMAHRVLEKAKLALREN